MTIASFASCGLNAATIWSTTSSSGSVICTRSAPATASPGVAATFAPNACRARAFASVRFQTVTESPRRSMPSTIAPPSIPVPRNATLAIADLPVESTPVFPPSLARILLELRRGRSTIVVLAILSAASAVSAQPKVLRWAGDPEGGAPFVEADPSHLDRVTGFDVEIAGLLAAGIGRTPQFQNVTFRSIDQSIARGDAEIGMSGIEDTPARRATMAVTIPYYEFREVLAVRDADASRFQTLADLRGKTVATLEATIAYEILMRAEREHGLRVVSYEDDVHPYSDLIIGRVDAVLLDNVLAERRHRAMAGFTIQPQTVAIGHYVGVLSPQNAPLRDTFNEILLAAMRDGRLEKILRPWSV